MMLHLKTKEMLELRSEHYSEELLAGYEAIAQYPKTVTIFGSARTPEGSQWYEYAKTIAARISKADPDKTLFLTPFFGVAFMLMAKINLILFLSTSSYILSISLRLVLIRLVPLLRIILCSNGSP